MATGTATGTATGAGVLGATGTPPSSTLSANEDEAYKEFATLSKTRVTSNVAAPVLEKLMVPELVTFGELFV
jgi:hypothetical protein